MISLERVDVVTSRVYISCICTPSFSQLAFECFMITVKTKLKQSGTRTLRPMQWNISANFDQVVNGRGGNPYHTFFY